mmetsp:Transcript_104608/g.301613  ORF Transcript_104608/g.301613 Transcript_104608/m.301613 type:complete len:273 (+) Transcript_104608:2003-2821(+)
MPVVRDTRTLVHVPEDVHAWLNTLLDGTQKVNAAGPMPTPFTLVAAAERRAVREQHVDVIWDHGAHLAHGRAALEVESPVAELGLPRRAPDPAAFGRTVGDHEQLVLQVGDLILELTSEDCAGLLAVERAGRPKLVEPLRPDVAVVGGLQRHVMVARYHHNVPEALRVLLLYQPLTEVMHLVRLSRVGEVARVHEHVAARQVGAAMTPVRVRDAHEAEPSGGGVRGVRGGDVVCVNVPGSGTDVRHGAPKLGRRVHEGLGALQPQPRAGGVE